LDWGVQEHQGIEVFLWILLDFNGSKLTIMDLWQGLWTILMDFSSISLDSDGSLAWVLGHVAWDH